MSVSINDQEKALAWAKEYYKDWQVDKVVDDLVTDIQEWFKKNGDGCNAFIGISGGKDSSIVAALMVKALGKERVIGVLMPQGVQKDIGDAIQLVNHLGIEYCIVNIGDIYTSTEKAASLGGVVGSKQAKINLAPRLRMATLYYVSQSNNGRVINTCNCSEDWVGYSTRYGDSAGDYGPLCKLTVEEVKRIGRYLGLPANLVDKTPADGLSGLTDEDNLGFTYAVLDRYIRTGYIADAATKELIDRKHELNLFKLLPLPVAEINASEYFK